MINKKRKFADNSADGAGDDEEISSTPGAKTIKKEVKKETFKLEDDAAQYYDMQSSYDAGSLDEGMSLLIPKELSVANAYQECIGICT